MQTIKGIAVYPRLNSPDTKFKEEGEYHTKLRIDAATADKLRRAFEPIQADEAEKVQRDKLKGKRPKIADLPITAEEDDEGNETGEYIIRVKMKASGEKNGKAWTRTVPIFDSKGKPSNAQIGGGSVLQVAFKPVAYYMPKDKEVGVSLYLEAVQIVELREGGNGASASKFNFEKIEGGYEATDEKAPSKSEDEEGGASDDYNF